MKKCCCGSPTSSSSGYPPISYSTTSAPLWVVGCGCNNRIPQTLNVSTIWTPPTTLSGFDVCDTSLHPWAKVWQATSTLTKTTTYLPSTCIWVGDCMSTQCIRWGNGDPPNNENRLCNGSADFSWGTQYVRAILKISSGSPFVPVLGLLFFSPNTESDCNSFSSPAQSYDPSWFQYQGGSVQCDPDPFMIEYNVKPLLCCITYDIQQTSFPFAFFQCAGGTSGFYGSFSISISE